MPLDETILTAVTVYKNFDSSGVRLISNSVAIIIIVNCKCYPAKVFLLGKLHVKIMSPNNKTNKIHA